MADVFTREDHELMAPIFKHGTRLLRGLTYFGIAFILLSINTYNLPHPMIIALVTGLFGLMAGSAKIGQFALFGLTAMVLLPASIWGSVG